MVPFCDFVGVNIAPVSKKTAVKIFFFQGKTGFCNFYTNIYEYLDPDLKNLISGLSESVKKCAKN